MVPFPARPDQGGRQGRPVSIQVNMFKINGFPRCNLLQYDVLIKKKGAPERQAPMPGQRNIIFRNPTKPEVNRRILKQLQAQYGRTALGGIHIAYDGRSNLYTSRPLPLESGIGDFEVSIREDADEPQSRLETFSVQIKLVKEVDMSQIESYYRGGAGELPQDCITALEVVMSHIPALKFQPWARSYFTPSNARPLGNGLAVWSGFFQSLRSAQCGLLLNVDVAATTFVEERDVLDIAREVCRTESLSQFKMRDRETKSLLQILKGILVATNHQGDIKRRVRVNGVSPQSATELKFECEGTRMSVEQYFMKQYNYRLRYPNLPCLLCGTKRNAFPLEVCRVVPGQRYPRKLDEMQTANMIKFTATKPQDRQRRVLDGMNQLKPNETPQLNDLGMVVDTRMLQVQGRLLEPPTVLYNKKDTKPMNGAWNLRDTAFFEGCTLQNWGVVVCADSRDLNDRKAYEFVSELVRMAQKMGLNVQHNKPPVKYIQPGRDFLKKLDDFSREVSKVSGGPIRFLLCMVKGDQDTYGQIKFFTDVNKGIPSQCMLLKHAFRPSPQYTCNLLLKINAKLGGLNSRLQKDLPFLQDKTIIFGADVTHPSPGARGGEAPSIAAVVASMNRYATSYSAVTSLQPSFCEEILCLENMVKVMLTRFQIRVGSLPSRIVFFRDGVSDGQFASVFDFEVRAIRAACMAIRPDGTYTPPITFVVVQKRHHVRFFAGQGTPTDRSGNVVPGLVVDNQITNLKEFDFYLLSHSGIQGTSRPVHYYVLHDENGFTSDALQEFCYNMCYNYVRCTRSVSIIPPCYYAHLIAYRARFHCAQDMWGSDTQSQASGNMPKRGESYSPQDLENLQKSMASVHEDLAIRRPMFFV